MRFYLGTRYPGWLKKAEVPLFLSWNTAARTRVTAQVPWALDSGGFTQIAKHGEYQCTPDAYAGDVRRLVDHVGQLQFAVVQDWPVNALALDASGLTPDEHQRRTIQSALDLMMIDPDLPWAPVLTGASSSDYLRHADAYAVAGIDLTRSPVVTVGALVGRPAKDQIDIIDATARLGVPLHGLGVKGRVLRGYASALSSADSMAWSFRARRAGVPLCSADASHKVCSSCLLYASQWAQNLTSDLSPSFQQSLYSGVWDGQK